MTLPPTSYAPVDSRTIGGFGGLRSSSAQAVLPSPANNNAAANGFNCFQRRRETGRQKPEAGKHRRDAGRTEHKFDIAHPPPRPSARAALWTGSDVALGETIAGRTLIGHSDCAAFHQMEFRACRSKFWECSPNEAMMTAPARTLRKQRTDVTQRPNCASFAG
jgi:hypothetical protein